MSEYSFKLPDLGEGTVESEIAEWHVKVGDDVVEEAVIGVMMTDKAAVEISSPVSGRVLSLAGEPGDLVAVGATLIVFKTDAAGTTADASIKATPAGQPVAAMSATTLAITESPHPAAESPGPENKVVTSPSIRRKAKEAGIDLTQVPGSAAGGRILAADFERYVRERQTGPATTSSATLAPTVTEIKVIGLRRIIAERMSASKREIPHFSYVEEIDITELDALRRHLNKKSPDKPGHLTVLPFICVALVRALKEFPQCNATFDKARNVVIQHRSVHLGVATQTSEGLKVPVVRHCEARSVEVLATEIQRITAAVRNNQTTKEALTGSTITITSLGKLGGVVSTPVINLPEVAIIGVNKAVERPVVVNGQIAIRLMMNLSSSFDHRFVDGYDAAAMIQRIKEMLEHPAVICLPE